MGSNSSKSKLPHSASSETVRAVDISDIQTMIARQSSLARSDPCLDMSSKMADSEDQGAEPEVPEPKKAKLKIRGLKRHKKKKTVILPPLTTALNKLDHPSASPGRVLPFKEYKKWLNGLRRSSLDNSDLSRVRLTKVTPLTANVRCQTATFRIRRMSIPTLAELTEEPALKPSTPFPWPMTTGRTSSDSFDSGIWDLTTLSNALARPTNKVKPISEVMSVTRQPLKPCSWSTQSPRAHAAVTRDRRQSLDSALSYDLFADHGRRPSCHLSPIHSSR
ncbi:hypothetical protein HDE_09440 [Halotydeus destructor]|nr:hypothetical protein HDE_09440 [Halotydeus destructor]